MKNPSNNGIGSRIRRIRKEAGLRQREMAALLGTSQSAIYKHERGVIPEPKRLLMLAKIGNTTIEWILTGKHWESGSYEMKRLDRDIMSLARIIKTINGKDREVYREALEIFEATITALEKKLNEQVHEADPARIADAIRELPKDAIEVLSASREIHQAMQQHLLAKQKSHFQKMRSGKNNKR